MKPTLIYILATSLVTALIGGVSTGCSTPPKPKPSAAHQQPNGEKSLRDSLAHTHPQPRRK